MATAVAGNTVKEDLVFGYDTNYGIADNDTSTRFYPGQPTTNLYTNPDFSNGETGWTFSSWSSNSVTHTATTVVGPSGNIVSANKLYMGVNGGSVHFHQYNGSKYTSGNTYTTSAWVKGTGTFAIKSHWGGNTNFTMTGDWQRVSMTVTATTSANGNFPYFAGEGLTVGSDFYITDTQTELKSNATPSVNGTRSSTASLIDLKRTANIDVSNVSFDSTGQPEFDGTDDTLNTGMFTSRNPTYEPLTIEAIVKSDTTANARMWLDATNNGTNQRLYCALPSSTSSSSPMGVQASAWSISTPQNTDFHHIVITMNGTTCQLYLDGVAHSSKAYTSYGLQSINIGGRNGYRWIGKIPVVRMYRKALTIDEITQNYNVYKNRFNI